MGLWFPTVSALIGLLTGGVVTYLTSRAQLRSQAEHDYDLALRDLRLPHYRELFHLTGEIPREWWPSSALNKEGLLMLRARFHDWYYGTQAGGMFLSEEARNLYCLLQNELQNVAWRLAKDEDAPVEDDIVLLREKGSDLRHQLCSDLGVSERPRESWVVPTSPPHPHVGT